MYTAWVLSETERTRLLALFPPRYPDVVAHHVTDRPGVRKDAPLPPEADLVVVGMADDGEKVQALVVEVNGSTAREAGGTYHLTWSLDREAGAKPVHSNDVLASQGYVAVSRAPFTAEPMLLK